MNKDLYIIHQINSDFYKIGMSSTPETRLQSLQTANPQKLELVYTYKEGDSEMESEFHLYFEDKKIHGEWFCITLDDLFDSIREISDLKNEKNELNRKINRIEIENKTLKKQLNKEYGSVSLDDLHHLKMEIYTIKEQMKLSSAMIKTEEFINIYDKMEALYERLSILIEKAI